jgi:glutamyl-tRNA synthetase
MIDKKYRGRIAPSPTGYLHVGHAMTFWRAQERARAAAGNLILRIEDLDIARCRPEFRDVIIEDLNWFGFEWNEGPDVAGAFAPYVQSERHLFYLDAWKKLRAGGFIYPCRCSRKDVLEAALAPHDENEEPIYPGTCRPVAEAVAAVTADSIESAVSTEKSERMPPRGRPLQPAGSHWRFRVPDGEQREFLDERLGWQTAIAGKDFGDFILWRRDDVPAYQLAVVVDDAAMKISEVVRGEDLLLSTFRQLLIYRALNLPPPEFYHAALVVDESGKRLAKRHAALSLRELRKSGAKGEEIRRRFGSP